MAIIDLKTKSYKIDVKENHLAIVDGANLGDFVKNIEVTINGIQDKANFLKTHHDCCTKENIATLKKFVTDVVGDMVKHKAAPHLKKRADQALAFINSLAA